MIAKQSCGLSALPRHERENRRWSRRQLRSISAHAPVGACDTSQYRSRPVSHHKRSPGARPGTPHPTTYLGWIVKQCAAVGPVGARGVVVTAATWLQQIRRTADRGASRATVALHVAGDERADDWAAPRRRERPGHVGIGGEAVSPSKCESAPVWPGEQMYCCGDSYRKCAGECGPACYRSVISF